MERIPEPELMLTPEQSEAYARADFDQPHQRFIDLFRDAFPDYDGGGRVLDLGCGPGDIAYRFAAAYPACRIDGIDGSPAMIAASSWLTPKYAGCAGRVRLLVETLPGFRPPVGHAYHVIISNSLLHHLHDSMTLWRSLPALGRPGSLVFVKDLMRPETPDEAARLRDLYVAGEPPVLQHDFYHSLFAAFTVDEVRRDLDAVGLGNLAVEAVSDRHLVVRGVLP